MDHPHIELSFGVVNKALEETLYRDFDTLFISIACDTFNACSQLTEEMIDGNRLAPGTDAEEFHKKLLRSVIGTLEDMEKRMYSESEN